jgi:hypothetical protein
MILTSTTAHTTADASLVMARWMCLVSLRYAGLGTFGLLGDPITFWRYRSYRLDGPQGICLVCNLRWSTVTVARIGVVRVGDAHG